MEKETIYDVIIVGAGVMGSATAYFLSKEYGKSVLLLEQFDFLHKFGSSHGESRLIRSTYTEEHYTYLMKDAYKLWDEVEAESGLKIHTRIGGLSIAKADNQEMQGVISSAIKHNVALETLSAEEVTQRFPAVKLPEGYIAVYSPDGGMLRPSKAVAMFQELAARHGCKMKANIKVNRIEDKGDTIAIHSSSGLFLTRKVVLTCGSWTSKLCPDLKLPLRPLRTVVSYWKVDDPEAFSAARLPFVLMYKDALLQGSFPAFEYPDMIKFATTLGIECDPDAREPVVEDEWNKAASEFMEEVHFGVAKKPELTETCVYTMTPDDGFIIDHIPGNQNVVVGCGFSGHGFKLAPVVGKILANLTAKGEHIYPHDIMKHLRLDRFNV